jgi:hypothetical protein
LFFRMPDGTFRLVGEDCCSPDVIPGSEEPRVSTYISVPYHVAWAEKVTGLDLTSCHDGAGWTGGSGCSAYPVDPDRLGSDWSTMCAGQTFQASGRCDEPDAGVLEIEDGGADADQTTLVAGDSPDSGTFIPNSPDSPIATDLAQAPDTSDGPIAQAIDAQAPPSHVDAAGGGKNHASGCACALATRSGTAPGHGRLLCLIFLVVGWRYRGRQN